MTRNPLRVAIITALSLTLTGCGDTTPTATAPQRLPASTIEDDPLPVTASMPEDEFDTWLEKPRRTRAQGARVQPEPTPAKQSSEIPPDDWRTPEFRNLETELSGENAAVRKIVQYAFFASLPQEETQKLVEGERKRWAAKRR